MIQKRDTKIHVFKLNDNNVHIVGCKYGLHMRRNRRDGWGALLLTD